MWIHYFRRITIGTFLTSNLMVSAFAQGDTATFYNASNYPLRVAAVYTKNDSILGLNRSGYNDPNPLTYIQGYFDVSPKADLTLPRNTSLRHGGKLVKANLVAYRVVAVKDDKFEAIEPGKGSPQQYAVRSSPTGRFFEYFFSTTDANELKRQTRERANNGESITLAPFYAIHHWENRNADNRTWIGVGAKGSSSAQKIEAFFAEFLEEGGFRIQLTNATGTRLTLRVGYRSPKTYGGTFTKVVEVEPGDYETYEIRDDDRVAHDGEGIYSINVEGKDSEGNKIEWDRVRCTRTTEVIDGKRVTILSGRLVK